MRLEDFKERHALGSIQTYIRNLNFVIGYLIYPEEKEPDSNKRFDAIITLTPENAKSHLESKSYRLNLTQENIQVIEKLIHSLGDLDKELNTVLNEDNIFLSAHSKEYRIKIKRGKKSKKKKPIAMADNDWDEDTDWFDNTSFDFESEEQDRVGFKSPFFQLSERVECLFNISSILQIQSSAYSVLFQDLTNTLSASKAVLRRYLSSISQQIIGIKLSKALKENKVTQAELAYAMGVSRQTVHSWCNGKMLLTLDKLLACCIYLSVTPDYLIKPDTGIISGVNVGLVCKEYGLNEHSLKKLKTIKNDKKALSVLNAMLSRYNPYDREISEVDVISELSKFIYPDNNSYLISERDIADMEKACKDSDTEKEDILRMIERVRLKQKNDMVALEQLETVLLRFKEDITE